MVMPFAEVIFDLADVGLHRRGGLLGHRRHRRANLLASGLILGLVSAVGRAR
jgi:hypothetical protein